MGKPNPRYKVVTIGGRRYASLLAACRALGRNYHTVNKRIAAGATVAQALARPAKKLLTHPVTVNGYRYPSIAAACEDFGMVYKVVRWRIREGGWDVKQALTTPVLKDRGEREQFKRSKKKL